MRPENQQHASEKMSASLLPEGIATSARTEKQTQAE